MAPRLLRAYTRLRFYRSWSYLFFAINLDPKHLPTAIISYDHSPLTRNFISNLQTSTYFSIKDTTSDEKSIKQKLDTGKISFAITIPANFTRKFIRG
ncbi:MAG: ABC transporter permease, partial [Gammaproteobacteria bacterium]|nr:ABC transporter permease [Gammaproteobacteria bacterium]